MSKQKNGNSRGKLSPDRPGFHILLAIAVTAAIFILAILFIRLFTCHGHEIEMPSYAVKLLSAVIVVIALTLPLLRRLIAERRGDREEEEA